MRFSELNTGRPDHPEMLHEVPQDIPFPVSLSQLVERHMPEILRREQGNGNRIRLYGAGEYWHAFEESAYQLSRIFDRCELTLFRHKDYPFPVVMASIPDERQRDYIRQHIPVCDRPGYKELLVPELSAADYRAWHRSTVNEFL